MTGPTSLRLLSVQVGRVAPLSIGDRSVMSGIRKSPVAGRVAVAPLGLAGDVLVFADCELRVTQPRRPCHKFVAIMEDPQAARTMIQTGFCGFYLAVDRPGHLEAGQRFELLPGPRETPLVTVFRTMAAPRIR